MELMKPKSVDTLDAFIKNKDEYIFQIKYDGGSSIIKKHGSTIEIFHGGNPNRQNVKYPELMQELKDIPDGDYIVELCVLDKNNVCVFNDYQKRCHTENKVQINYFLKDRFPITAIVHDVIKNDNTDVQNFAYVERLKTVEQNIIESPHIKIVESFDSPDEILKRQKKLEEMNAPELLEGIVIKKRNSPYLFDKRDNWYKIRFNTEETVKCVNFENTETGIVLITEDGRRINLAGERSEGARRKLMEEGCVMCEIQYHERTAKGYRFTSVKRVL